HYFPSTMEQQNRQPFSINRMNDINYFVYQTSPNTLTIVKKYHFQYSSNLPKPQTYTLEVDEHYIDNFQVTNYVLVISARYVYKKDVLPGSTSCQGGETVYVYSLENFNTPKFSLCPWDSQIQ